MYVTDSPSRGIHAYDYDAEAGLVFNRRMFFQLGDDDEGVMDGCAIDTEGHLWAAVHQGSRILRISPAGQVVSQIALPCWKPTCPAFGGPNRDELFITSAGIEAGETPPAGSSNHEIGRASCRERV